VLPSPHGQALAPCADPQRPQRRRAAGQRRDDPAALRELLLERLERGTDAGRGDVDRVERRLVGQAPGTVADGEGHVFHAGGFERLGRPLRQVGVALDRPHVRAERG